MCSTNTPTSIFSLDGRSISAIGLSPEMEEKLRGQGIVTLERLALLAQNRSNAHARKIIEAMRVELAARLFPYTVWCYSTSDFALHFIIRADDLFFFKASVIPDDNTSWTCTYQWYIQEDSLDGCNTLAFFHKPSVISDTLTSDNLYDGPISHLIVDPFDTSVEEHNIITYDNEGGLDVDNLNQDDSTLQQSTQESYSLPALIGEALELLNDRERHIIELRYGLRDGNIQTLEAVGSLFGCTRARIGQIEQKALKKVRRANVMQKIQSVLASLETALEYANGVLSIPMAVQRAKLSTGVADEARKVVEAQIRFLLDFGNSVDIPKNTSLVALKNDAYAMTFRALPEFCAALQRILGKAPHPLHWEAILTLLEESTRGQDTLARISKATLIACIAALPQVAANEQGYYYLVGRIFDTPTPINHRLVAKPPIQRVREVDKQTATTSLKSATQTKQPDNGQRRELFWESYDIWNHAIATYITAGAQRGSTVYLSIDDEVIGQISRRLNTNEDQPSEELLPAIRQRVVQGRRVALEKIRGRNRHGEPNCIAFLAAMVLAASRMAEDEEGEISSSNYFTRFCEVLEIDQEGGRPLGMKFGAEDEEPLWREWIVWLSEIGLISSARAGQGKQDKFINYPISQTLLRVTDRDRLRRLFRETNWSENWDADTLLTAVRREGPYLTKHLRILLDDQSQRIQAIAEAIYEVYEAWTNGGTSSEISSQERGYTILAELLRTEDLISGTIEYFLYPRSPRRQKFDSVVVNIEGQRNILIAERPGWYMPVCAISEEQLNRGARFPIEQPEGLETLVLPRRAFWLLSPDPNNPESGVYASWGSVPLGTSFILLCRREIVLDLEKLRTEHLIEWSGDPQPIPMFQDWVEVIDCMVISPTWDGVQIENRDLHDALRPKERLSIGLSGGLRAPVAGWLAGLGPQVTTFGFPPEAEVSITRVTDSYKLFEDTRPTNHAFDVAWPVSGDYLIEAISGANISRRLVKIVDWDELESSRAEDFEWVNLNTAYLCGALIDYRSEGDQDATLV